MAQDDFILLVRRIDSSVCCLAMGTSLFPAPTETVIIVYSGKEHSSSPVMSIRDCYFTVQASKNAVIVASSFLGMGSIIRWKRNWIPLFTSSDRHFNDAGNRSFSIGIRGRQIISIGVRRHWMPSMDEITRTAFENKVAVVTETTTVPKCKKCPNKLLPALWERRFLEAQAEAP